MTPFDYIKDINFAKEYIEDLSNYVPFVINRSFSYHPDTVFIANELNIKQNIPEKAQYLFLLNTISKAKRFAKWEKKSKIDDLEVVKTYFGYSAEKAKQALKVLNKKQLELIRKKLKGIQNE